MHTHIHTYITYIHTLTQIHTLRIYIYIHMYIPKHTHKHTYNLRSLIQNVHCFLQSPPQANSMTTPEIKPRPLPIHYYTDVLSFDVTQHYLLAASLNYKHFRSDSTSVGLHCRLILAAVMSTFGLTDIHVICYVTFVLILISEQEFSDVDFN
jgi:hypothetical protein